MNDNQKTKEQLVQELEDLRRKIAELEKTEIQRKRAEEALQESDKNYRNLFENANEAIFVAQEGKLVFLNPKTVIMIGYSVEELMSRPFIEFIHPDDRELVLDRHVRRIKGEELPHAYDFRVIQKDSNIRWVELKVVAIHWKGKPATLNLLYDITERKQTEKLLLASEARLKAQYQGSPIATFTWQKKGETFELVDYNQAAKEATKGKVIKFLGKTAHEMYRGRKETLQDIHRCFTDRQIIKKELQSQHFLVGRTMIATYAFVPPDLVMVHAEDISERKRMEEALRESEERYRTAIEQSNDGIALVKRDRHIFVNQKMVEIFGYDRPEEIIGQPVAMLVHPDDRERVRNLNRQRQKGESVPDKYEVKGQRKNGESIYIEVSAVKTTYQEEAISLVYLRDITDRKRGEEALRTLSIKDDLTGLYNRRGFFALAEQGLKTAQRLGTEMLLIYGDLDNLKEINDTFGHKEGDQALVDISQILKETFRESDILARIGGDEFVMLAMDTLETSAEKLINRFEQVLNDHHLQTKPSYKLTMSFGVACFNPKNPSSIDALLVEADKLMYENKQRKVDKVKNGFAIFMHNQKNRFEIY